MKKFKDWKIKTKLLLLTGTTLFSILLLSFISSFFFNTSRTIGIMVNGIRVHQSYIQNGVDNLYLYKVQGNKNYSNAAINYLDSATVLTRKVIALENDFQNKSHKEISTRIYNDFPEIFNHQFDNAEILINRLHLLTFIFTDSNIQEARQMALQTLKLSEKIQNDLMKENIDAQGVYNQLLKLRANYSNITHRIDDLAHNANDALIWSIVILSVLLGVIIYFLANYISKTISISVKSMVENFSEMAKGNFDTKINIKNNDELGALAKSFYTIQKDFQRIIDSTKKIANGNLGISIRPKSKEDQLSVSLNQMVKTLRDSKAINEETMWFRSGINELNKELQGDLNLTDVSYKALHFICEFLNIHIGAIYAFEAEKGTLKQVSSIGLPSSTRNRTIELGHGIVGQAGVDKKNQHIKKVPDNYFKIFSATGETFPNNILVIPLLFDNSLWGVLEIASQQTFTEKEKEFVISIQENIAVKIASTIARNRLENLLSTTQEQAVELKAQQEQLKSANEELEEHTRILTENEKKLQVQQEQLKIANEELEDRSNQLELQKDEIEQKNNSLSFAHKRLEDKANELQQASQYKSDFLANMSHELRTPLNSLLILSSLLAKNKNGNLLPEDIESLQIINRSGEDLLQLINEILDLSKIEAGKMTIQFESVFTSDIQNEILLNFSHQTDKKGLEFNVNITDDFPEKIETDRLRINQIIRNLLSNAIKFTSKGGITVSMEKYQNQIEIRQKDLDLKNICIISVEDTGVGIPNEKKEAIFEAFQQADGSTTRQYGGTGLGLSISKELARMLGGEIHLSSEVNKGSVFTLVIPINQNREKVTESETIEFIDEQKPQITVKETQSLPLFIDDDRDVPQTNISVILIHPHKERATKLYYKIQEKSFHVIVAKSVEDAIKLIESYQPQAIIVGTELLLEHGKDVINDLRIHPSTIHLPIHILNPIGDVDLQENNILSNLKTKNLSKIVDNLKIQFLSNAKKILIVEDHFSTRKIVREVLTPTNAKFDEAPTAEEAYQLIKTRKYDCMILDLGLPDYSGKELLKKLKQEQIKIPDTVIYTGQDISREEHRELSKYTNSIILKDVKSDERLMDEVSLFLHNITQKSTESPQQKNPEIDDQIFKGKKILVVDDEIRNVFALTKILEDKEIEVFDAENGKIAIDILTQEQNIDLVLMDIMMPEMDGYEAMEAIRKNDTIKDTPIICLTAKAMKEDYEKAIKSGANDYLSKPIDENKLFSMLKIWLYN